MNRKAAAALAFPLFLVVGAVAAPAVFSPANHESRTPAAVATEHHEAAQAHPHGKEPVPTLPADYKYNNRIIETANPAETTGTAVNINGKVYTPCVTEDYEGPQPCYWDAAARSGGKGLSFLWDPEVAEIMYLDEP